MAFNFGAAPKSSGFSFGASATPASSAPTAAAFSFGATVPSTSIQTTGAFSFSLGGTTSVASSTPAVSSTFTFGGTPASTPAFGTSVASTFSLGALGTAAAAAAPTPSFNFSASTPSVSSTQPLSISTATVSTLNFAAAKPAAVVASVAASNSTGFSLGTAPTPTAFSLGSTSTSTSKPVATVTDVLPTLSFASTLSMAATSSSTAATTSAGNGVSLGSKISKTTTTSTTATSLGGLSSVSAPAKQMSYKELEDTVDKWLHDLAEQEKAFLSQAAQVNTWDKQLIENGEKVTELNNEVARVKADQQRLDRELDFILSQQEELEELLQPIEVQVKSQQLVQHVQHSDVERERTYNLADSIDAQLKRMMEDLREIIERINSSNLNPNQGVDETMASIGKILNSHMDSLQWVDQNTNHLQKRLEDASTVMETRKVEHEKTFHLSYERD